MIWYLLYPFRGTTEPPHLSPNHPIRNALRNHGASVARHWLIWILVCVAVAVVFCYPFFFLYENPTTGFSKLPYHVWTSAKRFVEKSAQPDVDIRQVWIHGSYMSALNHSVLKEALSIQDTILGEETGCLAPLSTDGGQDTGMSTLQDLAWAFHSPLLLWNCSYDFIHQDTDLLRTVNNQSSRKSLFGFTLRPTSVFAGKSFEKNKLTAADALVITLFDRVEPNSSRDWNTRFAALTKDVPVRWSVYPEDTLALNSELYQFQFKPMSLQDDLMLFIAYVLMIAYVLVSVRKLRAFKSKFGLVVAVFVEVSVFYILADILCEQFPYHRDMIQHILDNVLAESFTVVIETGKFPQLVELFEADESPPQIGVSILASFSICGALKIDLAMMPREAYPFVILVIGLENMFRLVNALLAYPAQTPTISRIANALGDVGHLSLASAGQNLFILWVLSKVVSPGVHSFCQFAACAIVVDFLFHLTFFLAVLSVDVQRMELQDSIERRHVTRRNSRTPRPGRRYWVDEMLRGRLPISSRLAGSAVSICFILVLNMHFFDNDSTLWALVESLKSILAYKDRAAEKGASFSPPPPINQARTPQAWLRIQDYNSAQEVIKFIRPDRHTIAARVYDPLNIVLAGSNRADVSQKTTSFVASFLSLVHEHLYPLLLVVIFAIAMVTLLMQYLLWNELPEEDVEMTTTESALSIRTLPQAHRLDIIKLEASSKGHFITVGLDRVTTINLFDSATDSYSVSAVKTTEMTPRFWPITHMTIDDNGFWAALLTEDGQILFWSLPERRLSHFVDVNFDGLDPLLFIFVTNEQADGNERLSLLVVLPNCLVNEYNVQGGRKFGEFEIGSTWLAAASLFRSSQNTSIIVGQTDGRIAVTTHKSDGWDLQWSDGDPDRGLGTGTIEGEYNKDPKNSKVKSIVVAQTLGVAVIARQHRLDIFDIRTRSFIRFISTCAIKGSTVRVLHSPRRECPTCRGAAVHAISFTHTHGVENTCVMRTFSIGSDYDSLICLSPALPGKPNNCKGILDANDSTYRVEESGRWESTGSQAVVGVRRPSRVFAPQNGMASGNDLSAEKNAAQPYLRKVSFLQRRRGVTSLDHVTFPKLDDDGIEEWDIWTLSSSGEYASVPLHMAGDRESELFVANPGPIKRLGKRSVVLAFGNRVKVVTLGNERFEEDVNEYVDPAQQINTARRRKLAGRHKFGV